jgi:hypothetical protein
MQAQIQTLLANLELSLEEINGEKDPIQKAYRAIEVISRSIEELRSLSSKFVFQSKLEEIQYFKITLPSFYYKFFYFSKVHEIEVLKKGKSRDTLRHDFDYELKEIEQFYNRNNDFFRYYYSSSTDLDEQIYSRNNRSFWPFENLVPIIDGNFSIASYKISWLMAYEKYRLYLEKEIDRLNNPQTDEEQKKTSPSFEWKGGKSFIVEGIVSLAGTELIWIDGKPASTIQLTEQAERLFHLDLKDFNHLDYSNRLRKKDISPFLNLLLKYYNDRANRLNK